MNQLYVIGTEIKALDRFAAMVAAAVGCPAEERESDNFPDGHYFLFRLEGNGIVVQIADDTSHPDSDFVIWTLNPRVISEPTLGQIAQHLHCNGYLVEAV